MTGLAIIFAQIASQAAIAPPAEADIQISARVHAREIDVKQEGQAAASVYPSRSEGGQVQVERNLPKGQRQYRNLKLRVQIDARLAAAPIGSPEQPSSPNDTQTETGD